MIDMKRLVDAVLTCESGDGCPICGYGGYWSRDNIAGAFRLNAAHIVRAVIKELKAQERNK